MQVAGPTIRWDLLLCCGVSVVIRGEMGRVDVVPSLQVALQVALAESIDIRRCVCKAPSAPGRIGLVLLVSMRARRRGVDSSVEVMRGKPRVASAAPLVVYGAIDMRRTIGGRHVFAEVNPSGQWVFVEE